MNKSEILIEQINLQFEYLLSLRTLFPFMDASMTGQSVFRTAPYYRNKGFDLRFDFGRKLIQEDIQKIISIGHWINQNYIIRICSLLEVNDIIPPIGKGNINQALQGWEEVDLVRRLRHKFAHSSGGYNNKDPDARKLYERLVSHFNIVQAKNPAEANDYPISIDVVLEPMTNGCKNYIETFFNSTKHITSFPMRSL